MDAVTDLDRRQAARVAQLKRASVEHIAAGGQGATDTAPAADTTAQPAFRKGDRWIAFNTFVDVIAPRLTLAERAVWLVMFRHARNGTVDTSERALATTARIDKATAGRALRRLVDLRLAWVIKKSTSKESTSRYGLQPNPASCLAAAIAEDERRKIAAHERRERNGGDRRGRRCGRQRTG